ncbi:unnamed protein product [Paramecium primaurelia]|uniref:Uncharacterized protein n=1 Tax=Paramecium primaurelia TaxID=5886 RepID=A0A8S1KIA5_PARPR|nr:unnamed protein product [Paramecium primaurelia]
MQLLNFDQLVYPIMMQIRALRDVKKQDSMIQSILVRIQLKQECQNKVECLVLCLMKFALDYVIDGPNKVQIQYHYERNTIKEELICKLYRLQEFLSKQEFAKLKRQINDEIQNPEGFSETSSDNEQESFQIKLTGQLKEFSPEIQKLNAIIHDLKSQLSSFEAKETRRRNSIDQLTTAHFKEVQALKQQIRIQSQEEELNEYIEVVYFDRTSTLEPEICEMMNEKIRNIKQQYEKYVQQFMQRKKSQQIEQPIQVKQKDDVNKSVENLTEKELIKLLLNKQSNPYIIWKLIEEQRSCRFLLCVLTNQEKQYGISYKEINEILRCNKQDLRKLQEIKNQMQESQTLLSAQFSIQIQQYKRQLMNLNSQIQEQSAYYQQQLRILTDKNSNQNTIQFQTQIEILNKKILLLLNDNINNKLEIDKLLITNKSQQQQIQFIYDNTKLLFQIIDQKAQLYSQLDKFDWSKDQSKILSTIQQSITNIDPFLCVLFQTQLSLLLFQHQAQKITLNVDITPYSKFTQTDEQDQISYIISNQPISNKDNIINKVNQYTQTNQFIQYSTRKINKTENLLDSNNIQINQMKFKQKFENDVFDRLFENPQKMNQKMQQLRPFIEKMNEKEFSDILQIFNSLQYNHSNEKFQLDLSSPNNQIVELPQQKPPQFEMTQRSLKFMNTLKQNKFNIQKKPSRSVDQNLVYQQANQLFTDLDKQRAQAQFQFQQSRTGSLNRRISRLIPTSLDEKLKQKRLLSIN